jgi:hypothetical protein
MSFSRHFGKFLRNIQIVDPLDSKDVKLSSCVEFAALLIKRDSLTRFSRMFLVSIDRS